MMKARVLVADALPINTLDDVRALGAEVIIRSELDAETLVGAMAGVKVLVVRSTRVTAQAIDAGQELALIVRAGAGTNTIDVAAASARGVYVANCPGKNAVAVAELAVGLMLALDRRLPEATAALREGRWEKTEFGKADGIHGKRLGVAGLGAIGREVLARGRALGMRPRAFSRSLTPERALELGVGHAASLEALAAESDVFSIHLPLTAATRSAVDARVLAALPPRAI